MKLDKKNRPIISCNVPITTLSIEKNIKVLSMNIIMLRIILTSS